MKHRTLNTSRGTFVLTRTGIAIGIKYRRPMPPPSTLPTVAANDDDDGLNAAQGVLIGVAIGLAMWCGIVLGILMWPVVRTLPL